MITSMAQQNMSLPDQLLKYERKIQDLELCIKVSLQHIPDDVPEDKVHSEKKNFRIKIEEDIEGCSLISQYIRCEQQEINHQLDRI